MNDNNKAVDADQVKDQVDDNKKEPQVASEADFGEEDDGAKATDLNQPDGAKPSEDNTDNSKNIVDVKASEAKDGDDKKDEKEKKKSAEADEQDWGSWQSSWQQKKHNQGLSHGAKKKLNRDMRDLVRAVHVGALAYVLPDKSKKRCLTWRAAVDLHLGATGRRPSWASHFIECKLCHRFSASEREFEEHYAKQHVDMTIYNQTLRRLKQWDTAEVPETEVEYNVNLIYTIGQTLNVQEKTIENDILQASGLDGAQKMQKKPIQGSSNRPRDPAVSVAASSMAPETPTTPATLTPRLSSLVEKGRAKMGAIQKPVDKAVSKRQDVSSKDNKRTKRDVDDKKKKTAEKASEKSPVVNIDAEEANSAYEYYSDSSEPPSKKAKPSASKKPEELDVHGWKKRATELEKLLHRVTKENKSLKRQLSDERAKKSRKSRSWKKAVKSLLEAGSGSSSEDAK